MKSSGSKVIGPHEALRREIYNTQSVELFHMYSTSDFLSNAQKLLRIKVHESSINDVITSQTRRLKNYEIALSNRVKFRVATLKDDMLNQEQLNRITHAYPQMAEQLAEQWRTLNVLPDSDALRESISGLESIKASTVQMSLNRLQEINNKEIEKILRHNQLLDSIRDNNQAHIHHVDKDAEEDEDEPS